MITLKFASVQYTDFGAVSFFKDGTFWGAEPHDTHHYAVVSHRCGCGDDLMRFAREHEVLHHLLVEWLYDSPSPVLWGLAHGEPIEPPLSALEEMGVQALHRWVNCNERPIVGPDIDWDGMKSRALELLP